VPASGSQSGYVYCFHLSFTPTSVQVTPDGGQSNGDELKIADLWVADVPAKGTALNHDGCPAGYQSAEVQASTNGSPTDLVTGIFITFN
jgi:hypothetical protein